MTKKKTTTAKTKTRAVKDEITRLKAVWDELVELYEDISAMGATLKEEMLVLYGLCRNVWNIGLQMAVVLARIVPLFGKMADRIKKAKCR